MLHARDVTSRDDRTEACICLSYFSIQFQITKHQSRHVYMYYILNKRGGGIAYISLGRIWTAQKLILDQDGWVKTSLTV